MQPTELTPEETYEFLIKLASALKSENIGVWIEVGQNGGVSPPETFLQIVSATIGNDKLFLSHLTAITADWSNEK